MTLHTFRSLTVHFVLDAATTAWVAAVFAVDSTVVSDARKMLVNNLIVGLKADGIWTKLDRLWLFAMESQTAALVDIVGDSLATTVNSPTFTVDDGFQKLANSTTYINSNFNPATAPTPQFVSGSACLFGWSNTTGADHGAICGINGHTQIYPQFDSDNLTYYAILSGQVSAVASNNPAVTGLYLVQETNTTNGVLDINGAQFDTQAITNVGIESANFVALAQSTVPGALTSRQVSCLGFGAGLTAGQRVSIYTRLRTYMTAVGVP